MQLPTKLLYNLLEAGNYRFATYHPHYKKNLGIKLMKFAYKHFFLYTLFKLLLLGISSDCIAKCIIYHLHYKEKLEITRFT